MLRMMGWFLVAVIIAVIAMVAVNLIVIFTTNGSIADETEPELYGADCIVVLGARVYSGGRLSLILKDRVDCALRLHQLGYAPKLLLSGDHGTKEYDEVNAMLEYAVERGTDPKAVFLDHAGFSTYDSIYRLKNIFKCEKIIIVTQRFHLYRALYIARSLGLEAHGVASDARAYSNWIYNEFRESLARVKDFLLVTFIKPASKYLGEPIPISGDATKTHDKKLY